MASNKRVPLLLTIVAIIFILSTLFNSKFRTNNTTNKTFFDIVYSTDKALNEFSDIDEGFIREEKTPENYEKAWRDLNIKLLEIREMDKNLQVSEETEDLVLTYRSGFYQVLTVTNDVVEYLDQKSDDPAIIIENREKFLNGLKLLREVKEQMDYSTDTI